ncbi:MAG: NosD domain-containing protein, partial [Thermoplasmata archaeon]
MAGKSLLGVGGNYAVYFYMIDWQNMECKLDNALRCENAKFSMFSLYLSAMAEVRTTDAGMETKGTPHAPIYINGNADFAAKATAEGWPGDGSQGNPYIIDGYDIDANGGSYGIWIENTDVYFIIQNCNVYNATDSINNPYGCSIKLNNVRNGIIDRNQCNSSQYGIHIISALNNIITNNSVFDNLNSGTCLVTSDGNNVIKNNIFNNGMINILLNIANNNVIANNNLTTSKSGIYLSTSTYNNITNNNFSGSTWQAVLLSGTSNYNIVINNNVSNSARGIVLSSSSYNTITNNNVSGNTWEGIRLETSSYNTITNNNVSSNDEGIYFAYQSKSNILTYNWLCNNTNYGVNINLSSNSNYIYHNYFSANNGTTKGVSGNCQAYDCVGGNFWYNASAHEGNYWSNWDGNGWGTANAYPIDGGAGASDWYPIIPGRHWPIHITNNAEFTPENGVVGGNGTQMNPYIIEGWEIDGMGGSYCIWIENTDVYFVIRNCNVFNATNSGSSPNGAGIALNNVIHGILDNNTCKNSLLGIYLYGSSQSNTITNNNVSNNTNHGIILYSSSNNTIANNNVAGNMYGTYLGDSNNNTITNNNATDNEYGIYLTHATNNTITNNILTGNSYGMWLFSSTDYNIIKDNRASNNLCGIYLYWSSYNSITTNNVSSNTYCILLEQYCTNNIITYNWLWNNTNYGIYITSYSTSNHIHHNNFTGNNGAGKGVNGNSQAYDSVGGNYWHESLIKEGNYWSNWDNNDWGTVKAYPIDGGAGASDWYPIDSHRRHPIHITNNAEFTPENGVVDGNGTLGNPYIIEGWKIDAFEGSYCIWIENTDAYFIIRNCTLYNAIDYVNPPFGRAIALNNIRNGIIENNTCHYSNYGICLYGYSTNNIIANNTVYDTASGIYLYSSSENNITNNTAYGNLEGFHLAFSNNNTLTNNFASGNSVYGIYLYASNNNTLTNNTVPGNDYGLRLDISDNNIVTNNIFTSNTIGIALFYSSYNNTITSNTILWNTWYGIYLDASNGTTVTYNLICNNTEYGIYISGGSTANYIHHNNFIGNNGAGKGVSGNCQAYDDSGGNFWYDNAAHEGNYWSNWDGKDNGTADAYPIDGGASASDWYPMGGPVDEGSQLTAVSFLTIVLFAFCKVGRKKQK